MLSESRELPWHIGRVIKRNDSLSTPIREDIELLTVEKHNFIILSIFHMCSFNTTIIVISIAAG